MENNLIDNSSGHGTRLTEYDKATITSAANWAKVIAILGFIGVGIIIILSVVGLGGAIMGGQAGAGLLGFLFYAVIITLYLMPMLYLFKFSSNIQNGLALGNQEFITQGFENLKKYFIFLIVMIIGMIVIALIIFIIFSVYFRRYGGLLY